MQIYFEFYSWTQLLPFTDTENEVADDDLDQDYEIILKRLTKLEKVCRTMACRVI